MCYSYVWFHIWESLWCKMCMHEYKKNTIQNRKSQIIVFSSAKRLQIFLPLNYCMVIELHYNGITFLTHHMGRFPMRWTSAPATSFNVTIQRKSFPIDAIPLVCEMFSYRVQAPSDTSNKNRNIHSIETKRRKQYCVAVDVNIPSTVAAVAVPLHADFMFLFFSLILRSGPYHHTRFACVICPHSVGTFSMILQQSFVSLWRIQSPRPLYIFL